MFFRKMINVSRIFSVIFFLCTNQAFSQSLVPPLNQKVIAYVKTTIGTQVNRGECWDLAYEALTRNEAMWDWAYEYGEKIDHKHDTVFPGDIVQFENVVMKYQKGNMLITETMDHHTAIVYRVIDAENLIFELAHQNTEFSGRKVGLSEFNLNFVTKGTVMFYRPVPLE